MDMQEVSDAACARYFTMMLEGAARTWLKNLPPNSINTWGELRERFIKNFQGTCKRPKTIIDLQHCVQRQGESAHHWVGRVAEIIHSSDNISAPQAVLVLEKACHYEPLTQKLGRLKRSVKDMGELMNALTKYAESDPTKDPGVDEPEVPDTKGKKPVGGKGQQQNNDRKRKGPEAGSELVANTNAGAKFQKGGPDNRAFKPQNFEEFLKGPCPKHGTKERPAKHTWEQCHIMDAFARRFQSPPGGGGGGYGPGSGPGFGPPGGGPPGGFQQQSHHPGGSGGGFQGNSSGQNFQGNHYNGGQGFQQNLQNSGQQQQNNQTGFQSNPKQLSSGQYHVFTTGADKRDRKVRRRSVNAVEPAVPEYLKWSEVPITWSREDHPPRVDNPGHLALVVAPQVGGYALTKVLMDGGSSINILYYDTFRRMGLTEKDLTPSSTVFHGIIPGKSAYPVGRIKLNVAFGTSEDNFRCESLSFEVVRIKSPYHALFGRPAYAKFMARPCYIYLKLKMPGPKGPITVHGSRKVALECEEGDAAYAEAACATEELKIYTSNVDPADMTPLKKPSVEGEQPLKFQAHRDTKEVEFTPGDSSAKFTIGSDMDPK
jgi:hypothetical protein